MIECTFLTEKQTCQHVDAGVGLPIVITTSACEYCAKNYPPEKRAESYVVQCWIYKERVERDLEVGDVPTNPKEPREVKPRLKPSPPPQRVVVDAPIITDPQARLEICEDCSYWVGERCKAKCSCKNRPRPLADSGQDCPQGLWARPKA